MKTWLTKLRISATFDTGSALTRDGLATSEETRSFSQRLQKLDAALSNAQPLIEAPGNLHSGIMSAVHAERVCNQDPQPAVSLRWLPAPVLAAVMLCGLLWWVLQSRPHAPGKGISTEVASVLKIGSAIELGERSARDLPAAVVAPLSDELGRVHLDLENTAQFLLTSLP